MYREKGRALRNILTSHTKLDGAGRQRKENLEDPQHPESLGDIILSLRAQAFDVFAVIEVFHGLDVH